MIPLNKQQIICHTCSIIFFSKKIDKSRTPKYCTRECYAESIKKYKKCPSCGSMFANYKNSVFCDNICRLSFIDKNKQDPKLRAAKYRHKRRSNLSKELDQNFLAMLIEEQHWQCFYCLSDLKEYKAIEHMYPVSKGGDNDIYNLVYACRSCNSRKREKTLEEYAIDTGNLYWLDKADLLLARVLCRI